MEEIEAVVRRIVAVSDVSVTTKRMVRKEYKKLRGADAVTTFERKIIKSTLEKIILELAEKMQAGAPLNSFTTNNDNFEKGKTITFDSKTCPVSQENRHVIENWNEAAKKEGSIVDKKDEVCKENPETLNKIINSHNVCKSVLKTSLVAMQPECTTMVISRKVCAMNRPAKTLLTSSEVLAAIMEGDTSDSEYFDSPQKSRIQGGRLSEQTYFMEKQGNYISDKKEKSFHTLEDGSTESKDLEESVIPIMKYRLQKDQIEQAVSSTNSDQESSAEKYKLQIKESKQIVFVKGNQNSEENVIPTKKCRLQEKDVQPTFPQNSYQCAVSAASYGHRSGNQRNVTGFFKSLCSQNVTGSPRERCSTDSSVEILEINNPKVVDDFVIEISSDSNDDCDQVDTDVPGGSSCYSKHKEKDHCKQRKDCNVMEWNPNCENSKESFCINSEESQLKQRTNNLLKCRTNIWQKYAKSIHVTNRTIAEEESEVCLLSESDYYDSSATELNHDPLIETTNNNLKDDSYIFGRKCNQENNNLVSVTRKQEDPGSDDSFTASCKIRKRNRFKKTKRIFESSDSDHDNIESCLKTVLNKNKLSTKNVMVEIKVLGKKCEEIAEIKYGVLSDLDVIENLDRRVSKSKKDVKEKSISPSETVGHFKKQKTRKQETSQSDKKKTNKNQQRVKFKCDDYHFKGKTCTSMLGFCILDSDSEDDIPLGDIRSHEDDIPLSNLRSHEDDIPLSNLRSHGSFAAGTSTFNKRPAIKTYAYRKVRMQTIQKQNSLSSINPSNCIASDSVRNETDNSTSQITKKARNKVDSSVCKINSQGRDEVDNLPCKTTYQAGNEVDISVSKMTGITKNEHYSLNVSTSKNDSFDFCDSDVEIKSSDAFLVPSRNTTFNSTRDNSFFANSNVYNLHSSDYDNEEDCSVADIHGWYQESDSGETSSGISDISSIFIEEKYDKENTLAFLNQTKPPVSPELSKLRGICRILGLILRNTIELAGCISDEDKVQRIKQLLKEKGMKGKPSLQKAEKLLLLKEMKELQCEKITSSQEKGCSRRETKENLFAKSRTSPGNQQNIFDKYIHNMSQVLET